MLTIPRNSFNHGGARNLGARHARGEVLVFATQDAIPTDSRCLELLGRPGPWIGIGGVCSPSTEGGGITFGAFARRENYPETAWTVSLGDTRKLGVRALFFSNAFSAVLRDVFDALGGFPTHMVTNEDMLFAARLLKRAHRIAYVADATVVHSHSLGTGATFRRYFDIGTFFRQNAAELHGLRIGGGGVSYVVRLMGTSLRKASTNGLCLPASNRWSSGRVILWGTSTEFFPRGSCGGVVIFPSLGVRFLSPERDVGSDDIGAPRFLRHCRGVDSVGPAPRSVVPGLIGMEPLSPVRTYASLGLPWCYLSVCAPQWPLSGFGRSEPEELRTQTQSILLVFGVGAVGGTFFRFNEDYSRAVLGITVAMLLPSLPLFRAVAKRAMSGFEWYGTRVHVLGRGPRYRAIAELLQRNATLGLRPTAAEGPSRPAKHCILVPDRLSVPLPAMLDQLNRQYRRVWLVPDLLDVSSVWVTARDLRGHLALEISNNLLEPRRRLFKRGIDIAVSAAFFHCSLWHSSLLGFGLARP